MADRLEELLAFPEDYLDETERWERLTGGDRLFQALREAVWEPAISWADVRSAAEKWRNGASDGLRSRQDFEWKLREIEHLIYFASLAAERAVRSQSDADLDRAGAALATGGQTVYREEDRGWIKTFLTDLAVPSAEHKRSIVVPIALVDVIEATGSLRVLELEVVRGSGEVYLHPKDALAIQFDAAFHESLCDAWRAACQRAGEEGVTVEGSAGRYRVLQGEEGKPIPGVSGRSAAGAAALGWLLAIRAMVHDEGLIVMIDIERDGTRFKPARVDGIRQKVEAVVAADVRYDRIVVGNEENRVEAVSVLNRSGARGRIDVLIATEL
jgi:hypothetical protein